MAKLTHAVHLEYLTVKPYFTGKNLVIYGAVALFLTTMSGSISSGIGVGLMIATLFVSYPFALAEKSGLDALYTTLSLGRKTVVQGRYIFTLLLNLGAILLSFVLAAAGLRIANAAGLAVGGSDDILLSTLLLAAIFVVIQAIQMPVYFLLGYTKAKVLSLVPFAALMAGYLAFMTMQSLSAGLARLLGRVAASGAAIPLLIACMCAVVAASYALSVVFYKRRAF